MSLAWQINKKHKKPRAWVNLQDFLRFVARALLIQDFFSRIHYLFSILINEIKQFAQLRLVFLSFGRRQLFLNSFISEQKSEDLNVNFRLIFGVI